MKKEISWKELVKKTADKHKKSGTFDFKTVLSDAGKEWEEIKAGKHEEYIQGKGKATLKKKSSKSKSKSVKAKSSKSKSAKESVDAEMILSKNILCKSCKGKVEKLCKKQSGGNEAAAQPEAGAQPEAAAHTESAAHTEAAAHAEV